MSVTLQQLFTKAEDPSKIFVGVVVQNCFGVDYTCKTGFEVVGKDKNGHDTTKVSDTTPDRNGIHEFCTDLKYKKYCDSGQVRVLYVDESESLGPAFARYFASKLWGGESYFVQVDAHLQFTKHWDTKYIAEMKATKSYPKVILSSYPPGFSGDPNAPMSESNGARLCHCEFSTNDVEEHIIRINTGSSYHSGDSEQPPKQISFMAAGFFFTTGQFLVDVPFDPLLPWCFMGEEIALSIRAWTAGFDIYAPRKNYIAHQYRPGRMGLPKFWESVGRTFDKQGSGFNKRLQNRFIQRVKRMVGYSDWENEVKDVMTDYEYYSIGSARSHDEYLKLTNIDPIKKHCRPISWCNSGTLE